MCIRTPAILHINVNKFAQSNLGRGPRCGAVGHGAVWQRGQKWSPEDREFTTLHQLVPILWAKPAHGKNIRGTLWVSGCVRVMQVCLVRVTFDHYAVRLVILRKRIICRHPVTPTGDSHGFLQTLGNSLVLFTKSGDFRALCTGGAGPWWLLLSQLQPGSRSRNCLLSSVEVVS